jgi:hypothetical protein
MKNLEKHSELINATLKWLENHPELESPKEFIFQVTRGINPIQANVLFKDNTIEENIVNLIEFYESETGEYPTVEEFLADLEFDLDDMEPDDLF